MTKKENQWGFFAPPISEKDSEQDKSNLQYVWKRLVEFVESTESQALSFIELDKELVAPPYGVKAGLLPLLYMYTYFV